MKLKKYKQLIAGVVIGSMASMGGVFASSSISAMLASEVKFKIDGVMKSLPDDYSVLMYNNRTYVPARFVAEELGAKVEWDNSTSTVVLTSKKSNECTNNPTPSPSQPSPSQTVFQSLPVTKTIDDVRVSIYSITSKPDHTLVYLKVKNNYAVPIQLNQGFTSISIDNEQYKQMSIDDAKSYKWDKNWFHDIQEEKEEEGFVALPKIPDDAKNATLYLQVIKNDGSQKVINFKFDISLGK